ncbi:MAG: DNA polymerase III subunit gamma/tau [Acidimicrobiales bacterium]
MDDEPHREPYRSLYRRYRPQRFAELKGQDHVALALRNAVRDGAVGHAYLLSGPRGTGKTSTARILAKALNCSDRQAGEPCGRCGPCTEIAKGTSPDVHELDAASNNGVEAMRDLVSRAALATPGQWKVYIIDEVHMLSVAASNALLKTLEEPPSHVIFALATTDPHKVLPTIRSRTQHFEFRLLGPGALAELVAEVSSDAGLGLSEEVLASAVRRGAGSARDALSALDQLAVLGEPDDDVPVIEELVEALCERDLARCLAAVGEGARRGFDADRVAGGVIERLREAFLSRSAPKLVSVPGAEASLLAEQARRMGAGFLVRSMEVVGQARLQMREALDGRIWLELALARLAAPDLDPSPAAVLDRLERLERLVDEVVRAAPSSAPAPLPGPARQEPQRQQQVPDAATRSPARAPDAAAPAATAPMAEIGGPTGPAGARATLGALKRRAGRPEPGPTSHPAHPGPRGEQPERARDHPEPREAHPGLSPSRQPSQALSSPPPGRAIPARRPAPPAPASGAPAPVARPPASPASPPAPASGAPAPVARPPASPASPPAPASGAGAAAIPMSRAELACAWGDQVLEKLPARVRASYVAGRFVSVEGGVAVFALPNEPHVRYCERQRQEVEALLGSHLGFPVPLRLVVDPAGLGAHQPHEPQAAGGMEEAQATEEAQAEEVDEILDLSLGGALSPGGGPSMPPAAVPPEVDGIAEQVLAAFPGAEETSPVRRGPVRRGAGGAGLGAPGSDGPAGNGRAREPGRE